MRYNVRLCKLFNFFDRIIEKVIDENLSRELFMKMIHQPKPLQELDFSKNQVDEQISKLMETDDVETVRGMLDSIIQMSHVGLVSSYILKVISLLSKDIQLVNVLNCLTQEISQIDSIDPIIDIYLKYIELSQNGVSYKQTREIAKLLIDWIDKLPDLLPLDDVYSVIMDNTLSYFSDEYPSFIDNLIAKNESIKLTKNLLQKLVKESVPTLYSSWLVTNLFDFFHHDRHLIENIIETLISQLNQTEDIQIRALFIIYYAFRYEADFYRLNDSNFGFTQNISIIYKGKETSFDCSFHTFNSTRRLYAIVSKKLKININTFLIKLNEDLNECIIQYNMPLQVLNTKPFETLKLTVVDLNDENLSNESELIKNVDFIEPIFLQTFQEHVDCLWKFLKNERYGEFVFEMMLLYEQFQGEKENTNINSNLFSYFDFEYSESPLQSILIGDCPDPLQFKAMRRVFPTAIKVFTSNDLQYNEEINDKIVQSIQFLINARYDQVSLSIICSSIINLNMKFNIPKEVIQAGLIECKLKILRDLIMNIVNISDSNKEIFMSLIDVALVKNNRNHVKQFFECIKKLNMPSEIFIPFYEVIDQLEYSHYKDPDEAFICLLDLIPINESTVNLTIDRLFSPPTCKNIAQPFVHTIESWTAALKFLLTPIAVPKLNTLLTSLQIPVQSGSSLSCDFTYKGRNGIYNLGTTCYVNALLQVFNAIQPFSLSLISYDTSQLTQFEIELRDIMAQLRYVRETVISTASFVDNIPNFENGQQDAIEFMDEAFIRQMNHEITDVFHGKIIESYYSYSDGQILSEKQDDFYILVLPTKKPFSNTEGFSRLDQAFEQFFKDEPIVGGYSINETSNERVEAYNHKSIIQWPDCLALQLERWEYSETSGGGAKLVHCFGFPIEIDPNELNCSEGTVKCDFKYNLVGVVIHQGTAEQGHYYAVVEGDDKEWYLCNDTSIAYFDIKVLPDFAFGVSEASLDEDISTAYLLFYCRQDMPQIDVKMPIDLEEKLNTMNLNSWPQTIFRNDNFLTYINDLLKQEMKLKEKMDKDLLYLGFHAFIKIAMCDEKTFKDWNKLLKDLLFSSKNKYQHDYALAFFDYIDEHVSKSLLQIFNRSQTIILELTDFISKAILIANDTLNPLEIVIQNIDLKCGKKQVLTFAYDLIDLVCRENEIQWSENIQQLQSIFQLFLAPITKDLYKVVGNAHSAALNSFLAIYYDLYSNENENESSGLSKAISSVFNINNLNIIATSLKKCSNFDKLLDLFHKKRPDVFFNFQEATQQTKSILSKVFTRLKSSYMENENDFDLNNLQSNFPTFQFNLTSFCKLMFSNNELIRKSYTKKLESYIEQNLPVSNFLRQKIIIHHFSQSNCERLYNLSLSSSIQKVDDDSEIESITFPFSCYEINNNLNCEPFIPEHSEESSIVSIVLGFTKKFLNLVENGDEKLTVEYTDLLTLLSRSCPLSFAVYTNLVSKVLNISSFEKVKMNMIEILRNIVASDFNATDQIIEHKLFDRILSSSIVTNESIELLVVLYRQANGSQLLASCVEFYLDHEIDLHGQMLINLLLPPYSLKPPVFEVREKTPTNILQVVIAVCLLNAWIDVVDTNDESVKELKNYIREALKLGSPSDLYSLSKPVFIAYKDIE